MYESAINELKKGNKIKHTHSHTSQILPFVNDKKTLYFTLTLPLPNLANGKFRPKFQISFCEILKNK